MVFDPAAVVRVWVAHDTSHWQGSMTWGSGFFVELRGRYYVVTAEHGVSETPRAVWVVLADWKKYRAHVVSTGEMADLALLQVDLPEGYQPSTLALASSRAGAPGESHIVVAGHPSHDHWLNPGAAQPVPSAALGMGAGILGGPLATARGVVAHHTNAVDDVSSMSLGVIMLSNTPTSPGMSGGPSLNALGEVVGVHRAGGQQYAGDAMSYTGCTSVGELWKLLEEGAE